jgi:hypothetical protein
MITALRKCHVALLSSLSNTKAICTFIWETLSYVTKTVDFAKTRLNILCSKVVLSTHISTKILEDIHEIMKHPGLAYYVKCLKHDLLLLSSCTKHTLVSFLSPIVYIACWIIIEILLRI